MGWKLVLELAESAQNSRMTSLLVNRHPDGFFAASWAGKDCGEFLLDDSNYSASSSPQPKRLSSSKGMESIFTFGRASQQPISDIAVFDRRVRRVFEFERHVQRIRGKTAEKMCVGQNLHNRRTWVPSLRAG